MTLRNPRPRAPECPTLRPTSHQAFDDFIFAFFAAEMVIKMVALGLFGQKCYLGDTWNRLDFFIVMAGYTWVPKEKGWGRCTLAGSRRHLVWEVAGVGKPIWSLLGADTCPGVPCTSSRGDGMDTGCLGERGTPSGDPGSCSSCLRVPPGWVHAWGAGLQRAVTCPALSLPPAPPPA